MNSGQSAFPHKPRGVVENKAQTKQNRPIRRIAFGWLAGALLIFCACSRSGDSSLYSPEELNQLRRNFQVTENIIAELKQIHKKTKTRPRPRKIEITQRQPRHVLHKAKLIELSVQNMRSHKGLEAQLHPFVHDKKVVPTEVFQLIDKIHRDVRELRRAHGIEAESEPAALPKKALPQDVYINLERINRMILGIDHRTIRPDDVHHFASRIVLRLRQLRSHRGVTTPVAVLPHSREKHPRDVYKKAHVLHERLKRLYEKQNHSIFGGVVLLNKKNTRIIPNDVMDVLVNIMADVEAMSASMPLKPTPAILLPEHITPSTAYDMIREGIAVVETML